MSAVVGPFLRIGLILRSVQIAAKGAPFAREQGQAIIDEAHQTAVQNIGLRVVVDNQIASAGLSDLFVPIVLKDFGNVFAEQTETAPQENPAVTVGGHIGIAGTQKTPPRV